MESSRAAPGASSNNENGRFLPKLWCHVLSCDGPVAMLQGFSLWEEILGRDPYRKTETPQNRLIFNLIILVSITVLLKGPSKRRRGRVFCYHREGPAEAYQRQQVGFPTNISPRPELASPSVFLRPDGRGGRMKMPTRLSYASSQVIRRRPHQDSCAKPAARRVAGARSAATRTSPAATTAQGEAWCATPASS